MRADLVLKRCRLRGHGEPVDVAIRGDRVCAIGAGLAALRELDVDGRVAVPGLVEAHIHLDKALLMERAPGRKGTLAEAIRVTGVIKDGEIVMTTETRVGQPWRDQAAGSP